MPALRLLISRLSKEGGGTAKHGRPPPQHSRERSSILEIGISHNTRYASFAPRETSSILQQATRTEILIAISPFNPASYRPSLKIKPASMEQHYQANR